MAKIETKTTLRGKVPVRVILIHKSYIFQQGLHRSDCVLQTMLKVISILPAYVSASLKIPPVVRFAKPVLPFPDSARVAYEVNEQSSVYDFVENISVLTALVQIPDFHSVFRVWRLS